MCPTIQALIAVIDAKYASAATDTDKVLYMNMAQNELSAFFGIEVEDNTLTTVIDQDEYVFPTGLTDISQIKSVGIGNQATVADRYDYTRYELVTRDDYPRQSSSFFQSVDPTGVKSLVVYPPPSEAGLSIRILYRKPLTELSALDLTATPDFDSRYHYLLAYYAIAEICSSGASADYSQHDLYMQKFESGLDELWKLKMTQEANYPTRGRDNNQWHYGKRYAGN